ncbi:hypothetical protein SHIRM173S_03304 [Streptomyces hirsutus]
MKTRPGRCAADTSWSSTAGSLRHRHDRTPMSSRLGTGPHRHERTCTDPQDFRSRPRPRRPRPVADRRRTPAAVHDRPAHGRRGLPCTGVVLPRAHRGHLRSARYRPQRPKGRPGRPQPRPPGRRRTRCHRGTRRGPGRDVREQRGSGDRARPGGKVSRRRDHPGGPRASAHHPAPRRPGCRTRPRGRAGCLRGEGLGRRHGRVRHDGVLAGRVHRGLLRPARAGPRRPGDAGRRRRFP